ncbi:MAG: hypothetical protein IID41_16840 [Planctomycetes bacterium]|nr:hypothetical protein [Planctomycetota bacterium]
MADVETTSRLDLTPLVLKREQVAALLQVSGDSIDNLHRTKQLIGVKVGKFLRWRLPDVKAYIEGLIPGGDA